MCRDHPEAPQADPVAGDGRPPLFRRTFLVSLVGATGSVLVGCTYQELTTGGGVPFLMITPQQEQQLGEETWARIRSETPLSGNRAMQGALARVGERILVAAGEPGQWEFAVFQGTQANAFALPGGKVGVYEGMFRYADDEAQLATVVGHEIGHNQARHAAARLSRMQAAELGMRAVSTALQQGDIGYANQIAALLGAGVEYGILLPYSRNQELEADRIGLINMARAGYDPRAAVVFWSNMENDSAQQPPEFLSTHPAPGSRVQQIEAQMPEALSVYQGGRV